MKEKRGRLHPNVHFLILKAKVYVAVERLNELGIPAQATTDGYSWGLTIGNTYHPAHFAPMDAIQDYFNRNPIGTRIEDITEKAAVNKRGAK